MLKEFTLKTQKEGLYNIIAKVQETLKESGVISGLVLVYCPHTTAGITINENTATFLPQNYLSIKVC